MKNIMIMIMALLIVASSSIYINNAVVISSNNNIVVCEDNTGNIWSYFGDTTKTTVSLVMYNNHTDDIIDDVIISAY